MTDRHIALLCAVNVGGRTLAADRQREIAEAVGLRDVRVYLRTGNLLFRDPAGRAPDRVGADLTEALREDTGMHVGVVMRTRDELAAEITANPYPEAVAVPASLHVVFLSAPPRDTAKLEALDPAAHAPDTFTLRERALYLHCPNGIGRSKLAAKVSTDSRLPGVLRTARNWNTVTRLLALADDT